jgi:hypothetical protein
MPGNSPTPFLVLISRQQYLTCHIKVGDLDRPIAALAVGKSFYSYFRAIRHSQEVFKFVMRLSYRGDRFIVTLIPKGYVVWLYEPAAQLVQSQPQQLAKLEQALAQRAMQAKLETNLLSGFAATMPARRFASRGDQ